jgi:phenylacetate-CoA ligase
MKEFFDALETRAPAEREAALMAALPRSGPCAAASPAMAGILAGVDAGTIASRAALARLPVTRKSELLERQQARARGATSLAASPPSAWQGHAACLASPGPIYEPEGTAATTGAWRALHAAGFRAGELVHNCFSYHLTPGAS